MKLHTLTFTGPDDRTGIEDLYNIQRLFPFVEYGILIGNSELGPRFPSKQWILSLAKRNTEIIRSMAGGNYKHSLHICGKYLDALLTGEDLEMFDWLKSDDIRNAFLRIQLNFHGEKLDIPKVRSELFGNIHTVFGDNPKLQIIFQLDGVNDEIAEENNFGTYRHSGLFDRSHGAGAVSEKYNRHEKMQYGFAGGLGPHNLKAELKKMDEAIRYMDSEEKKRTDIIWVDMETHVRSMASPKGINVFDLYKVLECVIIAHPYTEYNYLKNEIY